MYCNAACKKKHRSKHKKACERRVAELHDEALFKQPPPMHEDCPICFLRMPLLDTGWRYKSCCGKNICSGCIHVVHRQRGGVGLCPFCRTLTSTSNEETVKKLNKLVDVGDAEAMTNMGAYYAYGDYGLPQDYTRAFELYQRAAELGYAPAHNNIGACYNNGESVEVDKKKAIHYYELAAIAGCAAARYALGNMDLRAGNINRAIKHYMIAVGGGHSDSLHKIQQLYSNGQATKEDYTKALQTYQEYLGEIKSAQRDEAAVAYEQYRYY